MDEKKTSWLATVPGLLTAGATFITALGGLIVILKSNNPQPKNDERTFVSKTMTLHGNVGKLEVVFNLKRNENSDEINGSYYYKSRVNTNRNTVYKLSGKISEDKIELTEFTDNEKTAVIILNKSNSDCYNGLMHNTNGIDHEMKLCAKH